MKKEIIEKFINSLHLFIGRTPRDFEKEMCHDDNSFLMWWNLESVAYINYDILTESNIQMIARELRDKY